MNFRIMKLSKKEKYILFFSIIFSIAQATGYFIESVNPINDWSVCDFFMWLLLILFLFIITYAIILHICTFYNKIHITKYINKDFQYKKYYIIAFVVIIFSYILVWLAYYPGFLNYEPNQIVDYIKKIFDASQPLIHTLFLGFIYTFFDNFENHNGAMIVNSFIQIVLLSSIYSYICICVLKKTKSIIIYYIVLIFYSFFPFHSILAISTTKDVIFTSLVLINISIFFVLIKDKDKINIKMLILFLFLSILMLLFRINGTMIWFLLLIISIILFIFKKIRLSFIKVIVLIFCIYSLTKTVFYNAFNISGKDIRINDFCSLPGVQLGRLYFMDIADDDDKNEIRNIIDVDSAKYYQYLADDMRDTFTKNLPTIIKTNLKMFLSYPKASIDAVLYLHNGAYYLMDKNYTKVYFDNKYMPMMGHRGFDINYESKFVLLMNIMDKLYAEGGFTKNPFLLIMFSPAFYNWLLIGATLILIYKKRFDELLPCIFLLLIIFTTLFGPCTIVRYYFPIMASIPLIYVNFCDKEDNIV